MQRPALHPAFNSQTPATSYFQKKRYPRRLIATQIFHFPDVFTEMKTMSKRAFPTAEAGEKYWSKAETVR
jgi:hypothetical protein